MKEWTQHEARSKQTVEAEQFNAQHRSARSQLAALDRSQYPEGCLSQGMVVTNALHRVYSFVPIDTGVAGAEGEQTAYRATDANTLPYQFRGVTYQQFGSGWATAYETSLPDFKGGNLLTEWFGCAAIQAFWTDTVHGSYDSAGLRKGTPTERYLGLRILYNGTVVAERIGPAKPMDNFSITGAQQMPPGPVVLTLQFKPCAAGPDDPIVDAVTADHLLQAHLFSNRVVCVGRWR